MTKQDTDKQNLSILRLRQVIAKVGLQRASIYRAIAAGKFPAPIALGARARGWKSSDIEAWIASRPYARDTKENENG